MLACADSGGEREGSGVKGGEKWGLGTSLPTPSSAAMETRVLIRSSPKPNETIPHPNVALDEI